jgi:hypothetical protein
MGWRAEDSLAAALLPFDDDEGKHGSDEKDCERGYGDYRGIPNALR